MVATRRSIPLNICVFLNYKWVHRVLKCATRQKSGEPSQNMVTLYTYVWTYNQTRKMHIPWQYTNMAFPYKTKYKKYLIHHFIKNLTALCRGPWPPGKHGQGWLLCIVIIYLCTVIINLVNLQPPCWVIYKLITSTSIYPSSGSAY